MERFQHISRIADLIEAELSGKINDLEREELERWKMASPENLSLYNQYVSESFIARKYKFVREHGMEEAYQDFKRKIKFKKLRARKLILYRIAGVVILFITLSVTLYLYNNNHRDTTVTISPSINAGALKAILTCPDGTRIDISDTMHLAFVERVYVARKDSLKTDTAIVPRFHTITIPRGGEYTLTLSDGSSLWMNSESEIRIPEHFDNKSREVYMTGEIYFDIARDTAAPFLIHTRQGDIKVYGTSFNVRDYTGESFLATTLVSGEVAFQQEGRETYLQPGEQLRVEKVSGETTVEKVDIRTYCSWKDGRFVFEKQRLEEIMNTISRWYDIRVEYESTDMKNILFTGNIKRYGDINQVIEMLRLINKIEIETNGKNVFVKSNK